MKRGAVLLWGVIIIVPLVCRTADAQDPTPTGTPPSRIGGVVASASGTAVADAMVVLTRAPDMLTSTSVTDSLGRFLFNHPGGNGEYGLMVSAAAFRPLRQRLLLNDHNSDSTLRIVLEPFLSELEAIKVTASRPPLQAPSPLLPPTGSMGGLADGTAAGLSPMQTGISEIVRSSMLGMSGPDGWSVAGLPGSESQTQLNGMLFRGSQLPASLPRYVRLSASSYDITDAGFSGGLVAIEIPQAGEFSNYRSVSGVGFQIMPAGTTGGSGSPEFMLDLGGDLTNTEATAGATFGLRVAAQTLPSMDLNSASAAMLESEGMNVALARTAGRLMAARFTEPEYSATHADRKLSMSGILRWDPSLRRDMTNSLVLASSLSMSPSSLWQPAALYPSSVSDDAGGLSLQWNRSDSRQTDRRFESTLSLSISRERSIAALPNDIALSVRTVQSIESDGFGSPVYLGGSASGAGNERAVLEGRLIRDARMGAGSRHNVRLLAGFRIDALRVVRPEIRGALSFASLDDFTAGSAEYAQLSGMSGSANARALRLSAGVADEWRLGSAVRLQLGLRSDVSKLGSDGGDAGDYGAINAVGTAGNNAAWSLPVRATISPRIGLSWQVRPATTGAGYASYGMISRHLVPAGLFRFGAGLFHRDPQPDDAIRYGPAGNVLLHRCESVNFAAAPGWTDIAPSSLQAACSNTAEYDRELRQSISRSWVPPSSFRSTASYLSRVGIADVEVGGLLNIARSQQRQIDESVSKSPFMVLTGEGGRQFFAPEAAIVTETGRVVPDLAQPGLYRDLRTVSDLASRTLQFSTRISPRLGDGSKVLRLGYVWTRSNVRQSGWESDAFGDPNAISNAQGRITPTHQLQAELGKTVNRFSITLWLRAQSGTRYSPLVAGDVNGDGRTGNDRAWIPSGPAQNPQLWTQVENLYNAGSKSARECIDRLRESSAGPLSCSTSWGLSSAMAFSADAKDLGLPGRGTISLYLENAGAFAGRLLGIPEARGWGYSGGSGGVSTTLLRPTGFDAQRRAFTYAVNPGFARRISGLQNGYRISLAFNLPLSAPVQNQQVRRWLAANGVGKRLSADELAARFSRNVPTLYTAIHEESENLMLDGEQAAILEARRRIHEGRVGRVWQDLGARMNGLPRDFDVDSAVNMVQEATDEVWELNRLEAHHLPEILTPIQQSLLTGTAAMLMTAKDRIKVRIVYY